jgi:hypothetical protein
MLTALSVLMFVSMAPPPVATSIINKGSSAVVGIHHGTKPSKVVTVKHDDAENISLSLDEEKDVFFFSVTKSGETKHYGIPYLVGPEKCGYLILKLSNEVVPHWEIGLTEWSEELRPQCPPRGRESSGNDGEARELSLPAPLHALPSTCFIATTSGSKSLELSEEIHFTSVPDPLALSPGWFRLRTRSRIGRWRIATEGLELSWHNGLFGPTVVLGRLGSSMKGVIVSNSDDGPSRTPDGEIQLIQCAKSASSPRTLHLRKAQGAELRSAP